MIASPTIAQLSMLRDDELGAADRSDLEVHTRACATCTRALRVWAQADRALLAGGTHRRMWRRGAAAAALTLVLMLAGSAAAVGVVAMILPATGFPSAPSDLSGARAATGLPLPAIHELGDWTLREVHVTRGGSFRSADLRYVRDDGARASVIVWTAGVSAVPAGTIVATMAVSGRDVTVYHGAGLVTASFAHHGSLVQLTSDAAAMTPGEVVAIVGAWIASAR